MAKAKKTKKIQDSTSSKRANKYEEKLQINGTFDEVMKALINPKVPLKKK